MGIDKVYFRVVRFFGLLTETHTVTLPAGRKSGHVVETFGFSLIEAIIAGAV